MLLQVEGIGTQKIEYKNPSKVEFDTLSNYILLAKKSISKFANKFYSGLASKMLKDEDAISSIANAIMMADWRYDENYESKNGNKNKTKYSYRNQCALWAIQTHVTKSYKKKKINTKVYSIDYAEDADSNCYGENIECKTKNPETILIERETKNKISSLINDLLSLDCLSIRQKDYIRLYYFDGNTFEEIGKKYNLTREAIRQSVNKAIQLIRSSAE